MSLFPVFSVEVVNRTALNYSELRLKIKSGSRARTVAAAAYLIQWNAYC